MMELDFDLITQHDKEVINWRDEVTNYINKWVQNTGTPPTVLESLSYNFANRKYIRNSFHIDLSQHRCEKDLIACRDILIQLLNRNLGMTIASMFVAPISVSPSENSTEWEDVIMMIYESRLIAKIKLFKVIAYENTKRGIRYVTDVNPLRVEQDMKHFTSLLHTPLTVN